MQTGSISLQVKPTFLTMYLYNMTQVSGRDYMDIFSKCFFRFLRRRHIYISVTLMNNPNKKIIYTSMAPLPSRTWNQSYHKQASLGMIICHIFLCSTKDGYSFRLLFCHQGLKTHIFITTACIPQTASPCGQCNSIQ